jgi:uncharacterized phage-associated protein
MARAIDVAKYIVERLGGTSGMKLQKLMYYSQAWHMVWREEALFNDDFQAWANGPVIRSLYAIHRRQFPVDAAPFLGGQSASLTQDEQGVVDKVLSFYGDKTAQWLSDLTHQETPWKGARNGLPAGEASEVVIDKASIHEYYSSL